VDGVVPVPLHPAARERGFNQADELARAAGPLAQACRCCAMPAAGCRDVPQAGLGARERYRNLPALLRPPEICEGRRDWRSSTTCSPPAAPRPPWREALLQAGAHTVEVWAVARGGTAQAAAKV
jgi:hypothetical protein